MADVTVDSLQIEIEANSSKAAEQVNKLSAALERLKQGIGGSALSSAAKQIKQLGATAQKSAPRQRKEAVEKSASGFNALKATKDLERIDFQIDKTQEKISDLKNRFNALVEIESSYPQGFGEREQNEIDKISQALSELRTKYAALKQQRDETFGSISQSVNPKFGTAQIDSAKKSLKDFFAMERMTTKESSALRYGLDSLRLGFIGMAGGALKSAGAIAKGGLNFAAAGAKKLGSALLSLGKGAVNSAVSGLKKLGNYVGSKFTAPFQKAVGVINKVKSAFGRIVFYRAIRSAIQMATNGLKEGINNLYQYSTLVGTQFAPAMNQLATASLYLKNSLGAMAAPLIEAVAPAVDFLIDKFVALLNVVNRVFAALTGKSTYTIAKKQAKDYADAANGAAKATQKFLLGIDELNILNEDSGGGGAGADYGSMFEEMEIDSDTLDWAKQIREAIENGDWRGAGAALANKLNGLLESWDSYSWGYALGQKITNGLNLIYGFLTTFNWEFLGGKIAEGLNGLMDGVDWDLLGRVFASKWNALVNFIYGFVTTFRWANLGTNISAAINGWFDEVDFAKAGQTLSNSVIGVFTSLRTAIQKINWKQIGTDIAAFLNNIDWAGTFSGIGTTIAEALNAAVSLVAELAKKFNWKETATALATGLIETVKTIDFAEIGTAINNVLNGALDFVIAFFDTFDFIEFTDTLFNGIGTAIENIDILGIAGKLVAVLVQAVMNVPLIFTSQFSGAFNVIGSLFESIGLDSVAGFFKGISDALSNVATWLKEHLVDPVVNAVKRLFGIHSPSTVFAEIGEMLIQGLLNGISEAWGIIIDFFKGALGGLISLIGNAWDTIASAASYAWGGISSTLGSLWNGISSTAGKVWSNITTTVGNAWENISTFGSEKWSSISSGLSQTWSNIQKTAAKEFEEIKGTVSGAWESLKKNATTWGKDICSNLAGGIRGAMGTVTSAVSSVAGKIREYLHFSEPDTGPLSDFHTYMPDMLSLMAKGIKDNTYLAENAAYDLANSVKDVFSGMQYNTSDIKMPSLSDVQANYLIAYANSNAPNGAVVQPDMSGSMRDANNDVINAVYAIGQQIIEAIRSNGGDVYFDGEKVGSRTTQVQNRQNRMYGKTLQNA